MERIKEGESLDGLVLLYAFDKQDKNTVLLIAAPTVSTLKNSIRGPGKWYTLVTEKGKTMYIVVGTVVPKTKFYEFRGEVYNVGEFDNYEICTLAIKKTLDKCVEDYCAKRDKRYDLCANCKFAYVEEEPKQIKH